MTLMATLFASCLNGSKENTSQDKALVESVEQSQNIINNSCDDISKVKGLLILIPNDDTENNVKLYDDTGEIKLELDLSNERVSKHYRYKDVLKDRNIILLDGVELSIQKDAMNFKTVNWTEYLQKEIFSIDFNIQDNPIRKNKNGLPISNIQKGNNYLVKVIQLENDWIKIRYENLNTKQRTEGWIKWRENNCLLIDIFQIA